VGERFLDAACNGGYFPLLIAERILFVSQVVGVDLDATVFQVAQDPRDTQRDEKQVSRKTTEEISSS
jgi:SAM-dependent methyltransferase